MKTCFAFAVCLSVAIIGSGAGCTDVACNYDAILPQAKEDYERFLRTLEKLKGNPDQKIASYECESDWLSPDYTRVRFKYEVFLTVADALECLADVLTKRRYTFAPEPNAVAACMWDAANNRSNKLTVGKASGGKVTDPSWWERFKPHNAIAEGPDCFHENQRWFVLKEVPAKNTTTEFVAATVWLAGQLVELVSLAPAPTLFILKPASSPEEACYETPVTAPPKRCTDTAGCPDKPSGAEGLGGGSATGGGVIPPGTDPGGIPGSSGDYP